MPPRDGLAKKSGENWDAGHACHKQAMVNAATSRFYYSLYEAARVWLDRRGVLRLHDEVRDVHATTANSIGNSVQGEGQKLRQLLNDLKEQRVIADYKPQGVDFEADVEPLLADAENARRFFLR